MQTAQEQYEQALARFAFRNEIGKAAWRLLMPPISVKRNVTVLVFEQFGDTTFPTLIEASNDNQTSVIAIEASSLEDPSAPPGVIGVVRGKSQSVIKFGGRLWSNERGQACVVFAANDGEPSRMKINHGGKLVLLQGCPSGNLEEGFTHAARRLLDYAEMAGDVPTCTTRGRQPFAI